MIHSYHPAKTTTLSGRMAVDSSLPGVSQFLGTGTPLRGTLLIPSEVRGFVIVVRGAFHCWKSTPI